MADLGSAIAGNFAAFAATMFLSGIYVGTVVFAILMKSKFVIRISELVIGMMFAFILFAFGAGLGKVMGVVVLILGFVGLADYFNLFKKNLDLPFISKIDYNICNFTCFIMIILLLLTFVPETAVGVAVGIIVLVVVLVLLMVFGGEVVAAAGAEAGAAGSRVIPEFAGAEKEGQAAINIMKQAGGRTAAVEGGAEKSSVQMVDETKQAAIKAEQEQAQAKLTGYEGKLKSLKTQLESVTDPKMKSRLQKEMDDIVNQMQRVQFPDIEKEMKRGGFGRFGRIGGSEAVGHISGSMWFVIIILIIFGAIFGLMALPSTSVAGQVGDSIENIVFVMLESLGLMLRSLFETMLAWVVNTFVPCEVGNTGVICQTLKYRSCEPFCISQTGEAQWKGFEITQLAVVPSTIFDYQPFSLLAEFTNNGEGDAIFTGVRDPTFGYYVSGNPICQWNIFGAITYDPAKCQRLAPISQDQPNVQQITSGKCALSGGKIAEPCTLSSTDSTQVRWVGFDVEPNVIPKGQTIRSDITVSVPYTFIVPNDLVGTMTVQSLTEQLTAETTLKKEGQIAKKINKAYSPPGPLMMAMGTAERQVVSEVPSLFIIQFANKGRGIVDNGDGTAIYRQNIRVYLPPGFKPFNNDQNICDFDLSKPPTKVSQLSKTKKEPNGKTEYKNWYPGPGFSNPDPDEDYNMYEIKNDIPAIIKTRTALETPTIYCVLEIPTVQNIQTFDFKMRVLEYGYIESKRTSISMTGTSIGGLGGGGGGKGTDADRQFTKSLCMSDPRACQIGFKEIILDFGEEYTATKITANAKRQNGWGCKSWAKYDFTAIDSARKEYILGATGEATAGSWADKPYSGEFPQGIKVKMVKAKIIQEAPDPFGLSCPKMDDFKVTITPKPTSPPPK